MAQWGKLFVDTGVEGSPTSVLDFDNHAEDNRWGPFTWVPSKVKKILLLGGELEPNTPGLDKVVEKILKMSQMDPCLSVTVNLASLAAKKPANMTSQAAMAQLAAGLSTLASDFVQLADLHHQTHTMVAFYKLGFELYETRRAMSSGPLRWAFSLGPAAAAAAGLPQVEQPIATDVLILKVKDTTLAGGDATSMGFFVW